MSRGVRRLAQALLPAGALLAAVELVARFAVPDTEPRFGLTSIGILSLLFAPASGVVFDTPLVRPDPVAGYGFIPGVHHLDYRYGSFRRRCTVTIDETGHRVTSDFRGQFLNRPQVWMLGCSFTWGFLLNDGETFAWKLQDALPSHWVRNFGGNGFGTSHAFLQLRDGARQSVKPAMAVIVYNTFHQDRNTISRTSVGSFRAERTVFDWLRYPVVDRSVGLTVDLRPVFGAAPIPDDPSKEEKRMSAIALFQGMQQICAQAGIKLLVAWQSGPNDDPIPAAIRQMGIAFEDIRLDLGESAGYAFTNRPLDAHPNPAANTEYARRLAAILQRALSAQTASSNGSVQFVLQEGSEPQVRSVSIANPTKSDLTIRLESSARWLVASPSVIQMSPGARQQVTLEVDPKIVAGADAKVRLMGPKGQIGELNVSVVWTKQ